VGGRAAFSPAQRPESHAVTKVSVTADVRVKVEFVLRAGRPAEIRRVDHADFPAIILVARVARALLNRCVPDS
jgi:hypothetical protein